VNVRHPALRARLAAFALLTGLTASALAAGATEYHCNGDGVSWTSTRPCPGTHRNELQGMGHGPQSAPVYESAGTPLLGKAPDYLPYLGIECAQLNDAIRTGPSRGLKSGPMAELRTDYLKRCSDDEASARQQLRDAEKQRSERRQDQQSIAEAEKSRAALSGEQCYEMLRILHGKRQRAATMSDGEKADLQRFEDNYRLRCPRR
jgi:hypothetical protein